MARFKVGVTLHPQHTTVDELRGAWRAADRIGVDTIWTWDHFFPLHGDPDGAHFESWSLLAAMACDTERASIGALVTSMGYRNPDLLADMARTIDHVSAGRLILGVGAGWFERDYDEYGYEFGRARDRLATLGAGIERIKARLATLNPPPVGRLPLMIGGGGEKVTLRLTAEYADMWNSGGGPQVIAHKNKVLDDWCERVGRDPKDVERTVMVVDPDGEEVERLIAAGAQHLIAKRGAPFDLAPVERLLDMARG
jgi:probable F420-dependent oxidoreductase